MSTHIVASTHECRPLDAAPISGMVPRARFLLDPHAVIISVICDAANVPAFNPAPGRSLSEYIEQPSAAELSGLLRRAVHGGWVHTPVRFKGQALSLAISSHLHIVREGANFQALWIDGEDSAETSETKPADFGPKSMLFARLFQAYLELEAANRRKAAMLAASTHEVRTPLAIMSGAAEMLLSEKLGPLTPAQAEITALFQQSCNRLMNTVNSFLTYAASEPGRVGLQLGTVCVGELLDEAGAFWRRVAKTRGLTLKTRVTGELPPVQCDREKVLTVIDTLCDNAMKFTPRGGVVKLTAETHFWNRRLTLRVPDKERRRKAEDKINAVRFSVSDNGVGIAPEFHNEIFDAFFRAPNNKCVSGVGLGLAIARDFVSAHGGKIWVDSHPGEGSSFHFVLPL